MSRSGRTTVRALRPTPTSYDHARWFFPLRAPRAFFLSHTHTHSRCVRAPLLRPFPLADIMDEAAGRARLEMAAASKARFRAACRASAACNAVMELQVLGGKHARRAWADS